MRDHQLRGQSIWLRAGERWVPARPFLLSCALSRLLVRTPASVRAGTPQSVRFASEKYRERAVRAPSTRHRYFALARRRAQRHTFRLVHLRHHNPVRPRCRKPFPQAVEITWSGRRNAGTTRCVRTAGSAPRRRRRRRLPFHWPQPGRIHEHRQVSPATAALRVSGRRRDSRCCWHGAAVARPPRPGSSAATRRSPRRAHGLVQRPWQSSLSCQRPEVR